VPYARATEAVGRGTVPCRVSVICCSSFSSSAVSVDCGLCDMLVKMCRRGCKATLWNSVVLERQAFLQGALLT
jgi:hypothetical protein